MKMKKPVRLERQRSPQERPHKQRCLATAMSAVMLTASLTSALPVRAQTAANSAARFRGEPITLNFVNADIEGVTRAMAAILKQQFVVDPRVKGTMTLYSEEKPAAPRRRCSNGCTAWPAS